MLERTRAMLEDDKAKQAHALLRSNDTVSELDAYDIQSACARVSVRKQLCMHDDGCARVHSCVRVFACVCMRC